MKKGEKLVIFDFDGTIADTKSVYYKAIGSELKKYGFSEKQVDKAIDIGMSLRKTLSNFGFGFITSWFLKKSIMNKVEKGIDEVKKCKDASYIKNIKVRKIIVTNSLKEFAVPVIKHLKLINYFEAVYGADDFNDKTEFIKNYLREKKIDKKNCFYIGDRAADVKLARKVGCKMISVSGKCSWDSRKEIMKQKPDFIIDDLDEVKDVISR